MSSEALERAEALLAVEASSVRAPSWWFAAARSAARDVLALLAEVARLERAAEHAEQQRAEYAKAWVDQQFRLQEAEAALAVAREREQRATDAITLTDEALALSQRAMALAFADLPCSNGCGCEEYDYCAQDEVQAAQSKIHQAERARAGLVDENPMEPSGEPAAATLAEPEVSPEAAMTSGSASAAADEPGETP